MTARKRTGAHAWAWLSALLVLAAVLWPSQARADFASGVEAYDQGDYLTAYNEWLSLARDGDPAAQRNIGHLYRLGLGVPQDPAVAVNWYTRAAESGLSRAQANLAGMYLGAEGIDPDPRQAAVWFQRAALNGHVISQFNLGLMFQRGLGVEKDLGRAMGWFTLAAQEGHEKSAEIRAALETRGVFAAAAEVLRGDLFAAVETPVRAGAPRAGEIQAAQEGRLAYRNRNYEQALRLWLPLAKEGNSEAQFFVGALYMDGSGVEEDVVRAHAWWRLAAGQGHGEAKEFLDLIRASMSEEQRQAAVRLLPTLTVEP